MRFGNLGRVRRRSGTRAPHLKLLFRTIEEKRITAVMSSLVLTELLVPAWRSGKAAEAERLKRILMNFPHLDILDLTVDIAADAARVRAHYNLKTADAIHAATAFAGGATILATNDRDFLRLEPDIKILLLD